MLIWPTTTVARLIATPQDKEWVCYKLNPTIEERTSDADTVMYTAGELLAIGLAKIVDGRMVFYHGFKEF